VARFLLFCGDALALALGFTHFPLYTLAFAFGFPLAP
jgi:hypothetical protein